MRVTISNYKNLDKGSALKAAFSLHMTDINLRFDGCKYFMVGERSWFNFPQREVKSTTGGKTEYYPMVTCTDKTTSDLLRDAVVIEIKKQQGENAATSTGPLMAQSESPLLWGNQPF